MQLRTFQQSIAQQQQNTTGKFVLHNRPIYSTSHSKPCASIGVGFMATRKKKFMTLKIEQLHLNRNVIDAANKKPEVFSSINRKE